MKILIAEDDAVSRRILQAALVKGGHEAIVAEDGAAAWRILAAPEAPSIAILDWMMPGLDGTEICRRLRAERAAPTTYVILLTARGRKEDILAGLESGADDYVTKPFDHDELRARVQAGVRIVDLQAALALRVRDLEEALVRVRHLSGLLSICSYCKKVRGETAWQQVESYVTQHSEARFSHSICPECYRDVVEPELERSRRER